MCSADIWIVSRKFQTFCVIQNILYCHEVEFYEFLLNLNCSELHIFVMPTEISCSMKKIRCLCNLNMMHAVRVLFKNYKYIAILLSLTIQTISRNTLSEAAKLYRQKNSSKRNIIRDGLFLKKIK